MNVIRPTSSPRPGGRAFALFAGLLALLAAIAVLGGGSSARAAEEQKPSFVLIQTDDQTLAELYATYAGVDVMPETLRLIAGRGMTFNRYYVPYPLCCPSRTSLLTGRYSHNNGVKGNVQPNGGFTGFASRGAYTHNLAVWLQQAGYRTIHIGKFLNGYGDEPYDNGTEVPPGWSAWHTVEKADSDHYYYGYSLNDNGHIDGPFGDSGSWVTREYGERDDFGCPLAPTNGKPCLYETDVLTRIAEEEIAGTALDQPFYLQLDYTAPHGDFRRPAGPEPAPRYYDTLTGVPFPHNRAEGFDEGNVSDKPSFIREAPPLSYEEIHTYHVYYQKVLESLRSVDDGVREIVNTLGALHRLRNTYIIFLSDNGFFFGEHRLTGGKFLAYEPSTHLPLLIRGPHIRPGSSTGELAANIDIAPTILELAGAKADKSMDGRSLVPFLHDPSLRTRRPILFESFVQTNDVEANGGAGPTTPAETTYERKLKAERRKVRRARRSGATASIVAPPKDYEGIRLGPYKYIEWPDGEKELYDINKDPNELNNRVRDPNLFPIRNFLHRQLKRLEDCVGRHCSEPAPPFPPTVAQRKKAQRLRDRERREREREKHRKEREKKKHHGG